MTERAAPAALRKELKLTQFFTIGFGAIIGTGWLTVMGFWLGHAGPLGAILAFLAGGLILTLVALCYAEVATMFPVSGAELAYAYEVFSTQGAFLVGWVLALVYISTVAFEAISAAWVIGVLIPGSEGPVLYRGFLGEPVRLSTVLIGVGGTAYLGYLNYRGIKSAARFQDVTTFALLLFAAVFMAVGLASGRVANLEPLFQTTGSGIAWGGVIAVFVMTPFFYAGFNLVPQAMEEMAPGASVRNTGRVMLLALAVAITFYCLVILTAGMTMPWRELLAFELPVAAAFERALRSPLLAKIVLLAALFGIVTSWNPVYLGATRVLFALGRSRIIDPRFAVVHARFGTPSVAVVFTGIVASAAILLGRQAILPIVSIAGTGFGIAFLCTCLAAWKLRRTRPEAPRPYRMPGGIATATLAVLGSAFVLFLAFYQPWVDAKGSLPVEWAVFLGWSALGALFWMLARKIRLQAADADRRALLLGRPLGVSVPAAAQLPSP
ncbi:MAG: amino acid permease [Gemmatimonadetes bacterium]|nr:amino acid permease [Gemmatimonadota bacterium]